MSRTMTVIAALAALAACTGSDAAEPTVAPPTTESTATTTTAPTTTRPPTTTTPSTTAPPTTKPATTAPPPPTTAGDPDEAAKAEVAARYEEFSRLANECVAAKNECDLPTVLGEYADPKAPLYQLYENRRNDLIDNNWQMQYPDRNERWVDSVEIAENGAVLVGCVLDRTVIADETGAVVEDGVGMRQELTLWDRVNEEWRLTGGTTYLFTDHPERSACEF